MLSQDMPLPPLATPPATSRETDPLLALQPPAVPRLALECLPMPIVIFEPSLRLNFINAAARRFFGVATHLRRPETAFVGADELFAEEGLRLGPPSPGQMEAMALRGESIEYGEWGEELRSFVCKRRNAAPPGHELSYSLVVVRASVAPFQPSTDYFAAGAHHATGATRVHQASKSPSPHSPSLASNGPWHIVTLLGTVVSPSSSNNETLGALTPHDITQRPPLRLAERSRSGGSSQSQSSSASGRAGLTSAAQTPEQAFAQFSAQAESRPQPVLSTGQLGKSRSPNSSIPTPGSVTSSSASVAGLAPTSPQSSDPSPLPRSAASSLQKDSFFPRVTKASSASINSSSTGESSGRSNSAGTPSSLLSTNTSFSQHSPAISPALSGNKKAAPFTSLPSTNLSPMPEHPASEEASIASTAPPPISKPEVVIEPSPSLTPAALSSSSGEAPAPPPKTDSPAAQIIARQRAQDFVDHTAAALATQPGSPNQPSRGHSRNLSDPPSPPVSLRQPPAWSSGSMGSMSSMGSGSKRPPLRPAGRPRSSYNSYTSSSTSKWSSPHSSSASTIHPAATPSPDLIGGFEMPAASNPLTLLTHAALAHLPNTGLLLASNDLSGGFVNDTARELLLGVRSPAHLPKNSDDSETEDSDVQSSDARNKKNGDWMEEGMWIAAPEPGGKWTWDGAEFFRGIDNESRYRNNQYSPSRMDKSPDSLEAGDRPGAFSEPPASVLEEMSGKYAHSEPMRQGISSSLPSSDLSSTNSLKDLAGLPNQVYKMTVATILRRSQSLAKARRKQAKAAKAAEQQRTQRPNLQRSDTNNSRLSTLREEDAGSGRSGSPMSPGLSAGTSSPGSPRTKSSKPLKKPYRVYDASFSQRIMDPLEPLLEMVARRNEDPDHSLGGGANAGGLVVGIEVEVSEAADLSLDAYTTSTAMPRQSTSSVHSVDMERKRIRRRLVEIRGSPIRKPDGTHLGGMLILRDVTDERRSSVSESATTRIRELTGKKLPESGEGYFKQILDHMPQMVWTTTPMGSHDYFNNQWYEYTGLEPEQSLGIGWQNPFHDDDMPHTIKAWSHSLATGDPYSVEYRCRRHDGAWRWMLGRALPMRDAEGTITGWFGSCTDVEDFIHTRYQLAKTQEQFKSVLFNTEMIIITLDTKLDITFFEGMKTEYIPETDLRVKDAVGKNYWDVFPWGHTLGMAEKMNQIMTGEETVINFETPYQVGLNGKDMPIFRVTLSAMKSEGPDGSPRTDGIIIVGSDISAMRNAEIELAKVSDERRKLVVSEAAAQEASRMKSEFVSTINHELRTPVSGMIGIAELLLDDPSLSAMHRDSIEKIMRSGEILLDMIGMVLDMGKVEAGKLELDKRPFHLSEILDDARLVAAATSRKGLRFVDNAQQIYPGTVMGDMPKLRQILSNLLSNAIKFTSHGSVTLTAEQVEETEDGVVVVFTVADTGVGIKNENLPHLFSAFQQEDASTSRKFGGTGLGLYISRQLAELMGGSITLASRHGRGTTATCTIPFKKCLEPIIPPALKLEQARYVDRTKIWILVAEDNEINREIVVRHLEKMKFNVKAVINGLEVLEVLQKHKFDLILMDGQMPEMDGYDATTQIRLRPDLGHQAVKIIALTAAAIEGDKQKCLDYGMDDYLAKPVRAKSLESMILRQLAPTPDTSPTVGATNVQ